VTLTINDTTMTTGAQAADTGSEPAAAAGPALAPEDQHPGGFEPRSASVRSGPAPDDLRISDEPTATWNDPPPHAIGREAGS
jgi:hypothetical protein